MLQQCGTAGEACHLLLEVINELLFYPALSVAPKAMDNLHQQLY